MVTAVVSADLNSLKLYLWYFATYTLSNGWLFRDKGYFSSPTHTITLPTQKFHNLNAVFASTDPTPSDTNSHICRVRATDIEKLKISKGWVTSSRKKFPSSSLRQLFQISKTVSFIKRESGPKTYL